MKGKYFDAGLFILLAGLMDIFDGKIARSLGISSKFGVEFDSLADVCLFVWHHLYLYIICIVKISIT